MVNVRVAHRQTVLLKRFNYFLSEVLLVLELLFRSRQPLTNLKSNRRYLERQVCFQVKVIDQSVRFQRFAIICQLYQDLVLSFEFPSYFKAECLMANNISFHALVHPVNSISGKLALTQA
jgi:hypothetical protein